MGDGFYDHDIADLEIEFFPENGGPVMGDVAILTHCNWIVVNFTQLSASNQGQLHARVFSAAPGAEQAFNLAPVPVATLVRGDVLIDPSTVHLFSNASDVVIQGFGFDVEVPSQNVVLFTSDNTDSFYDPAGSCTNASQAGLTHSVVVTFSELGPFNAGGQIYAQAFTDSGLPLPSPVAVAIVSLGNVFVQPVDVTADAALLTEVAIGSSIYNVNVDGRGFAQYVEQFVKFILLTVFVVDC